MSTVVTTGRPENAEGVPDAADPFLVLERMDEGFYAIDRDWRLLAVNSKAEAFWGLSRAELLGRSMMDLFPKFAGSPAHEAHRAAIVSGLPSQVETTSSAIGRPVELRLFPSAGGLSVYFRDLTERRALEEELVMRNQLLTLAELSAGIGVWVADLTAGTVTATPQFFRLLGLEPSTEPVPQEVPRSVRHPADRERVTADFRDAIAAGAETHESEYRIIRPSGEERWIFGRGRVTRDAAGKPWRYAGVDLDVTERKEQDEHLRMVMREMMHRTNNLLAVVQGIARQTARNAADVASFMAAFSARLEGLGESNQLLSRRDWRGAALDVLIQAQTAHFAEQGRFILDGPAVTLSPKAVQNLGLALHELCTNALKYGSLSLPAGEVAITWRIEDGMLHLRWKETGGPAVTPPSRTGFGRIVSEQMIASALEAKVDISYEPDGILWTLDLPAAEFTLDRA